MSRYNFARTPPPVSIGITLEEDGWWLWCPECDEAMGPYDERGKAATARGRHLVNVHDGPNFAAKQSNRAAMLTAHRDQRPSRHCESWSEDEDRQILAAERGTLETVARQLGRTVIAAWARRAVLRENHA